MEQRVSPDGFEDDGFAFRLTVFDLEHRDRNRSLFGLLDTGATTSMIRSDLAKEIGLRSVGERLLSYFDGSATVETYAATVLIGQHSFDVVLSASRNEHLDFIIGRDILRFADISLSGPAGRCHVEFTCECIVDELKALANA